MQSDKHLNNVQELNAPHNIVATANGTVKSANYIEQYNTIRQQRPKVPPLNGEHEFPLLFSNKSESKILHTEESFIHVANRHNPVFRCDMCNYDTSIARNLRIHMTSDKHTQNLATLQNNIKQVQALSLIQQRQTQSLLNDCCEGRIIESSLPNITYNQTIMMQLLHRYPTSLMKVDSNHIDSSKSSPDNDVDKSELESNNITSFTSDLPFKINMWPTEFFSCLICENFNTNNIEALNEHLLSDRSYQSTKPAPNYLNQNTCGNSMNSPSSSPTEFTTVQNNNYICVLCKYKTNLRANFHLHSKTDKHIQKVNFVNHLREGGTQNERKLKYYQKQHHQMGINSIQLKCNCCDFFSNSIHQLKLHTKHTRHDAMKLIFEHMNRLLENDERKSNTGLEITQTEKGIPICVTDKKDKRKCLCCKLCKTRAKSLTEMIHHIKATHYLQIDNLTQTNINNQQQFELNDIFSLSEPESTNQSGISRMSDISTPTCSLNLAYPGKYKYNFNNVFCLEYN